MLSPKRGGDISVLDLKSYCSSIAKSSGIISISCLFLLIFPFMIEKGGGLFFNFLNVQQKGHQVYTRVLQLSFD